jgi:hypothetical protein
MAVSPSELPIVLTSERRGEYFWRRIRGLNLQYISTETPGYDETSEPLCWFPAAGRRGEQVSGPSSSRLVDASSTITFAAPRGADDGGRGQSPRADQIITHVRYERYTTSKYELQNGNYTLLHESPDQISCLRTFKA